MRSHRCLRTTLTLLLVVSLSITFIPNAVALSQEGGASGGNAASSAASATSGQAASTATFEKSEVVYATLAADGGPEAVYVVNRFDVEAPGVVVDYGDYDAVQSLTSELGLARDGDVTSFEAEEGVFYYQGDRASTALPWNVSIEYRLDGKKVRADELAGATGALAIRVTTAKNASVDSAFYDSFLVQATVTLPGDAVADVTASEGATVASAGRDTTVAFTSLPGHDGDFELTAQVRDFSMAGMQIVALPYSSVIEMPSTDGMVNDLSSLSDAVSQLASGTASLASGVRQLTGGAQSLSSGAAAFGQGLRTLDESSSLLVQGSAEIKSALDGIAAGLSEADFSQIDQLKQLPGVLDQLAGGLEQLKTNASATQQGYAQALGALDGAIAAIPVATLDDQDIASLAALAQGSANPQDAATASELVATYRAAQAVKGTYGQISPAFVGANDLMAVLAEDAAGGGALATQAATLRTLSASLNAALDAGKLDQLPQLAAGISELAGKYGLFHEGLAEYASGLSALAANYCALESGASQLVDGTSQLSGGADALTSGMGELDAATITLPQTVRDQIAEMTADYDFPKFEPVSFVSDRNEDVAAVQFVMTTAAIEKPEVEVAEEPAAEPSLWDRFVALFVG